MTKLERMRALLAAGDLPGAVALAHELLTAHGHESAEAASLAMEEKGYKDGHNWPVYKEALQVIRSNPEDPGFFGVKMTSISNG